MFTAVVVFPSPEIAEVTAIVRKPAARESSRAVRSERYASETAACGRVCGSSSIGLLLSTASSAAASVAPAGAFFPSRAAFRAPRPRPWP